MTKSPTHLTKIRGVGSKTAERIKETLDIEGVEDLVEVSKDELKEVKGIGEKRAGRILGNLEDFFETCDRCGENKVEKELCQTCLEDLEKNFEQIKHEIEDITEDLYLEEKDHLVRAMEEIKTSIEEEEPEEGFQLLESLKYDLEGADKLSDKLIKIKKKLDEGRELLYVSAYEKELEKIKDSFKNGVYERGNKRADKIIDYIESEEEYVDMENDEFLKENIVDFTRKIIGTGPRVGEEIYGSGFHTLKEVYQAGSKKIHKKAEIKETTSDILMDKVESLFEKKSLGIERDLEGEIEEEGTEEDKEDTLFEALEREDEEKKKKKIKHIENNQDKTETSNEIFKRKNVRKLEKEVNLVNWIPAILVSMVLIIAGYLMFFVF